jgi:hypothetical protein
MAREITPEAAAKLILSIVVHDLKVAPNGRTFMKPMTIAWEKTPYTLHDFERGMQLCVNERWMHMVPDQMQLTKAGFAAAPETE